MAKDPIEKQLKGLRRLVKCGEQGAPVAFHAVPEELAREGADQLVFTAAEMKSLRELQALLASDRRFEHLEKGGWLQLVDFVARVEVEPDTDHVGVFMEQNAENPQERLCYFPVELLSLSERVEVAGVSLVPMTEAKREKLKISVAPEVRTVAAVPTVGTDLKLMAERGRAQAEHALRILRISLREDRFVHAYQLRFRLANHYSFEAGFGGWEIPSDAGWELELDRQLLDLVKKQPVWRAPLNPRSKLERRVDRAMRWIEQSYIVGDELLEMLFCFFGLEALLGDKSEGLKSHQLAFRRALLGSVARGHFAHPNRVAFLYGKVRSAAVHGSEAPKIDRKLLTAFVWDTRLALNEYVDYASENNLKRPGKVLASLEENPKRELLIKGLREQEPELWGRFLDDLEGK